MQPPHNPCKIHRLVFLVICALLGACSHLPERLTLPAHRDSALHCHQALKDLPARNRLKILDRLSELMEQTCLHEALTLGDWIRRHYREKLYSVSAEFVSVLTPEDALSEYIMESYERAWLSALMAAAWMELGQPEKATVELRRSYEEGKAWLYTYGEDPVNTLLLAALWDNLDQPESSRPFWKKLQEMQGAGDPISDFASARLRDIDDGRPLTIPWRISALGRLPELDWNVHLFQKKSGYYTVQAVTLPSPACESPSGLYLSTSSWVEKISQRYNQSYHPLLNFKSWVRLPVGVTYGLTVMTVGAGLTVGGCLADARAGGSGELCQLAAQGGQALVHSGRELLDFTLRPDLRRWRKVPAGLLVSMGPDLQSEPCWRALGPSEKIVTLHLGGPARGLSGR